MIKFVASGMMILSIAMLLSACGNHSDVARTSASAAPSMASEPVKEQPAIRVETYMKDKISIAYPQLANLSDAAKQNKINEALKDKALEAVRYYEGSEGELSLTIDQSSEMRREHLISVIFKGMGNVEGAAYPNNHFYTANMDLKTGKPLRLSDLIDIDADFVNKLKASKPKDGDPESVEQAARTHLNDGYAEEDWIGALRAADLPGTDNIANAYSYVMNDSLGVSLGVPHALGDHVEYEIPIAELGPLLTPVGRDLLGK
ncbi:hypothetical protein [Cohnella yongneupensis]|uniref:DUF3298 domain-containing protein n=1 Tax=Cohnella yongneupensis TaxID=425006 RepID=A0ABW0R5N3_9BACL